MEVSGSTASSLSLAAAPPSQSAHQEAKAASLGRPQKEQVLLRPAAWDLLGPQVEHGRMRRGGLERGGGGFVARDFLPVGSCCRELLVKISAMVILESSPRLALKFSGGIRSSKWTDFHSPGEARGWISPSALFGCISPLETQRGRLLRFTGRPGQEDSERWKIHHTTCLLGMPSSSSPNLFPTRSSERNLTTVKSQVAAPSQDPWDFSDQHNVQQMGAGRPPALVRDAVPGSTTRRSELVNARLV